MWHLIYLYLFFQFYSTSYWLVNYSGYSGDLEPELTMELLRNDQNAILIDVRPEARDYNFHLSFCLLILLFSQLISVLNNLVLIFYYSQF